MCVQLFKAVFVSHVLASVFESPPKITGFGSDKIECSIIPCNKINIIKGHSKQKDVSLKSKSVKSLKCVLNSLAE